MGAAKRQFITTTGRDAGVTSSRAHSRCEHSPLKNVITIKWSEISSPSEAEIAKLRQQRTAEVESKIIQLTGTSDQVKAEADRLRAEVNREIEAEIENIELERHKKFKEEEELIKSEITDADTFEYWREPYEWVSKRIAVLNKEFANILEQLDQYRHGGLGERLHKAANEIIEGEYREELDARFVEQGKATQTGAEGTGADGQLSRAPGCRPRT
jgi:hypothetical protein